MFKGGFIQNLPKIYGLYTGGFAVFILLMALAESAGVSAKNIGVMFVAFTVGIYAFIGCLLYTPPSPRDQRGTRMPSSVRKKKTHPSLIHFSLTT